MLPPLFEMEDYEGCFQNKNQYCKVQAVLEVPPVNIKLAKELSKIVLNQGKLDRSILYRALCLPSSQSENQPIETQLSEILNKKIQNYNLTSKIDYFACTSGKTPLTFFDSLILVLIVTYLVLICLATYTEASSRNKRTSTGILHNLSLFKSWKTRTTPTKNEDYQNLLSIQGLRAFIMSLIIVCHVLYYYLFNYIDNPDSMEKVVSSIPEPVKYLMSFLVLGFFPISSWLSTLQAYNLFEKHGKFSLRHCNPISWYVAADFQMYFINTLLVYIIFKFKLGEFKVYGLVLLIFCFVHGIHLYNYNLFVLRATVKNFESRHSLWSMEIVRLYTTTITISSSSFIGVILGAIYFKNKNTVVKSKGILSILWGLLFFGLPSLALLLSVNEYGRLNSAILGAIVKPMYCLGLGIGVLGMSHNIGGIVKRIFENKYAVFLSKFSFSIYICHWMILAQMYAFVPVTINNFNMMKDLICVFTIALALGIFVTLIIEEPCLSLQKQILPQIKRDDKDMKNRSK